MPKQRKVSDILRNDILDVLVKDGVIVGFGIDGQPLPDSDVNQLKADANVIESTMLWKLLGNRACFVARHQSCDSAKDFGDTREARGMIRTVAIFNEIIDILRAFEKVVAKDT